MEEIALALAALQLAKQAVPVIEKLFQKGAITIEQQKQVLDDYNALKTAGDLAFSGPEWQIEPDPS